MDGDITVCTDMGLIVPGKLNLNLGCGTRRVIGYVNCDLYPGDTVDIAFDAQGQWPFDDNTVDAIYSSHLLEHLSNPMAFFREMWRCLKPGGTVMLRMPYGSHRSAWGDITHVRPWFPESFCCIQPGYSETSKNRQYNGNDPAFWVQNCTLILSRGWSKLYHWPLRAFMWWGAHNFPGIVEELRAFLKKTTRDDRSKPANIVGMSIALKVYPKNATDPNEAQGIFQVENPTWFETKLVSWLEK